MIHRILSILFLASPLIIWTALPYPHSFPRMVWISVIGILLGLVTFREYKKTPFKITWIDQALVGLFLAFAITTLMSVDPSASLWGTLERSFGFALWPALLCGYFGLRVAHQRDAVILWRTHIIITLLMSLWGLAQAAIPGFATTFSGARIGGTLGNAIFFGMYLTLSIGAIAFYLASNKTWRLLGLGVIFLAGINLLLANSTGAILGLISGLIVACVFYLYQRTPRKQLTASLIAAVLICLIVAALYTVTNNTFKATTTQTRFLNWGIAWNGFLDRPVLGWGYGMYRAAADAHFDPRLTKFSIHETHADKPHNTQLELLVTTGIIGALAYLALLLSIVFSLITLSRTHILTPTQTSILLGIFVANEIQNATAFPTNGTIIVFLFILAGLSTRSEPISTLKQSTRFARVILAGMVISGVILTWLGMIQPLPQIQKIGNLGALHSSQHTERHAIITSLPSDSRYLQDQFDALSTSIVGNYWQQPTLIANLDAAQRDLWNEDAQKLRTTVKSLYAEKKDDAAWQLRLASAAFQMHAITHEQQDAEQAKQIIERAHELSPRRQEPLLLRSQLELERKNYAAAIAAASEAQSLDPELVIARWYRGTALLLNKQPQESWPDIAYALSHGHEITSEQAANFIYNQLLEAGMQAEAAKFAELINK